MLYAIAAVIVLIIDQATKYWTILNLIPNGTAKPFIPGFIELVNVHNTGAAFGIFDGGWARWIFVVLTLIFTVAVIYMFSKNIISGGLGRWSLVMVLAGGLGNCIDRMFNGYVVDMFHFQFMEFAVFNVADIFITVFGIVFCCFLIFHKEPQKETKSTSSRPLPRATERPKKGADYLTQLQKPVIEGREAIETERRNSAPPPMDDGFSAWNMPQSEPKVAPNTPPSAPASRRPAVQSGGRPVAPEPRDFSVSQQEPPRKAPHSEFTAPAANPFTDTPSRPTPAPKKSGSEFNIEDIIAEFKDR